MEDNDDDDDDDLFDFDDGACEADDRRRSWEWLADTRGGFGGLQSVAGGGGFLEALGLGGGRTRAGFGGSRPWINKKMCFSFMWKMYFYVFEFLVFHI